jgi:HD-GYP domain-containing protein (c-di-GMP phosphodiesterase class II)
VRENNGLAKVAGSLIIAFVSFVFILLGSFFLSDLSLPIKSRNDDFLIKDWEFIWGLDSQEIEGDQTSWSVSSSGQPIRKPADRMVETSYIRMSTHLSANNQERTLEVTTLGNPIKVKINDIEVYNNQYSTSLFTGNRVNIVEIPVSEEKSRLDVYVCVPYAFALSARLTNSIDGVTANTLLDISGLIAGSVLLLLAILLSAVLVFLAVKYQRFSAVISLSITMISSSVGFSISQLSLHSAGLNHPIFWKLQLITFLISAVGMISTVISGFKVWRVSEKATIAILFLYLIAFTVTDYKIGIRIMMFLPLILLLACIVTMLRLWELIRKNSPFSTVVSTAFLTGIFCLIFDSVFLFAGWGEQFIELRYLGTAFFSVVMFLVLIKQAVYSNVRMQERALQIELNNLWAKKAISSCAGIFAQQNIEGFCRETALAIKELVAFDNEIENNQPCNIQLKICVGLYENGEFKDYYTENEPGNCSYKRILERAAKTSGESPVLYRDHTLDIIFYLHDNPSCIIHIEGLPKKPSSNLLNTVSNIYSGIAESLNSLELKENIVELQESVFISLAEIAEKKHDGTGAHLKVVSEMVYALCGELGMSEHEKRLVSMASMVHDIGKLAIPDGILRKNSKLTDDEYAIMQDHVIYGYNIMSKTPGEFMAAAAVIAQQHHEKYDGTGYIEIKGEEIHLYARIVAIADVFDALLSVRPYKKAWTAEQACHYIEANSGTHFDPKLVKAFVKCKDKLISIKRRYAREEAYV